MGGGGAMLAATSDVERIEAPVTVKAYLMCAFGAFGGIFFGFESGYINGVLAMPLFVQSVNGTNSTATSISSSNTSLIVSILSAGTFFGAIIAGDVADAIGRRPTVIVGCGIYIVGCVLQVLQGIASGVNGNVGLIVSGRLIAGFGVGFVSAIIILYLSEISPRKVRGALVSGYQFCITLGLLIAACTNYGTQNRPDTGSYRIPIALQFLWALILGTGLFLLPESPRYHVKKGNIPAATGVLSRLRGQPQDSEYIQQEVAEIIANHEYELSVIPSGGYFQSWFNCFRGSLFNPASNVRRTILGTSIQMMQQWTGVNFVFYFGTTFFTTLGTIQNPFLISLITTLVNVCSTPISFYTIEKFGRRPLLIWGAIGMFICQYIVAIVGVATRTPGCTERGDCNTSAISAMIGFICIYIFFFASTWGPGAWVLIGELFPLPIRSRGVALSTASNWLWNCIITVITPYLVGTDRANLSSNVFWLWGSLCFLCIVYAYVLVPETKGLSLEQVDRMLEEVAPRNSAKWKPHTTFAADTGAITEKGNLKPEIIEDVEVKGQGGH